MFHFLIIMFQDFGVNLNSQPPEIVPYAINGEMYYPQRRCLEVVVFREAVGEGIHGKRLVAQVIVNRTFHPEYPDDVCSVVRSKQYNNGKNMLQHNPPSYKLVTARKVAEEALQGKYKKLLSGDTLFFKRCDVDSGFFSKLQLVKRYKQQCFYREV